MEHIFRSIMLVGVALFFSILCLYFWITRKKVNEEVRIKNEALQEKSDFLEKKIIKQNEELNHLEKTKSSLMADINTSQEISYSAFSRYQDSLEESYTKAEEEYDRLIEKLKAVYTHLQYDLSQETKQKEIDYQQEIESIKQELNKLRETRAAALEAQRREELMRLEKDSYRVILTPTELTTIEMINEIKPRLPEPRILCMLIWQTFYQKKLDALCKRVLGANIVCGIYKITNIKNNMCYIGQSKDMDKRWKDHMKCALGIDTPIGVKLYQAMKADGADNFTFELLETCPVAQLNEKEKFYIDLYQSKDFGYNSTSGNK